jgi:hypothetical protein
MLLPAAKPRPLNSLPETTLESIAPGIRRIVIRNGKALQNQSNPAEKSTAETKAIR